MKDRDIARAVGVSVPSVERTRCVLAEHDCKSRCMAVRRIARSRAAGQDAKKRVKTPAHRTMVPAAEAKRVLCMRHGRRAGSLCSSTRPKAPAGVFGRVLQTAQHPHVRIALRGVRAGPGTAVKKRIEWHFTPKQGSWLNMAEIEIGGPNASILTAAMLPRRKPSAICSPGQANAMSNTTELTGARPPKTLGSNSNAFTHQLCWIEPLGWFVHPMTQPDARGGGQSMDHLYSSTLIFRWRYQTGACAAPWRP